MTNPTPTPTWQQRAAAKKAAQAALIPAHLRLASPPGPEVLDVTTFPFESVLSARDMEITSAPTVGFLLERLQAGEWTAVEVTGAFCNRALVAHQLVNCLSEILVDAALERAKELDEAFAKSGPVGPLHGLPISLKDQICIKGVDTTMGYVAWIGDKAERNAALVDILLAQGAVPYVRTNVPQTLMWGETHNNVFGRTTNPFNRNVTCGGSSGGEGALIGLRGSVLGVGSDIGGSIRIPAAFQGLYGLRPSYNRVPYQGSKNSMMGQEIMPSVLGPISSSIDGLTIFMKAVMAAQPWRLDPLALRLPWSEPEYNLANHGGPAAQLVFALQWDDGYVKPQAPYARALQMTKDALIKAGHKVVDWVPYKSGDGYEILGGLYFADGVEDLNRQCALSGEPLLTPIVPEAPVHLSTYEYWQLTLRRNEFIKGHLDHWEATKEVTGTGRPVDAIITAAAAAAPHTHDEEAYIYYTGLGNLCDLSAAVFPVTKVDPAIDVQAPAHKFHSALDERIYNLYKPEVVANVPISLQLYGRKNEEEAVIRMTEIVDAALKVTQSAA